MQPNTKNEQSAAGMNQLIALKKQISEAPLHF